ncbi:MAG: protein tyrosine phosphatase [Sciscionella sp.]
MTVCLGNICRSPLAAAVLARHGGSAVESCSAGLRDKWAGQPADPAMIAAAARRGYDLTRHRAVQVNSDLIQWADLVLAMDVNVLAALLEMTAAADASKIESYLENGDVPDPFGQAEAAFLTCAETIESGALRHLQRG